MLATRFGDPVLMVRPHPARLSIALVERSAREGTTPPGTGWPNPVNQARAFTAGSASIHCRPLLGGAQGNSRSTAHRAPLYFRAAVSPSGHGRIGVSVLPGVDVLSIPCRWLLPVFVPAHGHQHSPTCNADTLHRRRPDQLQVPAPSATDLARCSLSRSVMWLAVFKMMHRFGGRQGCGELLTAFAAFSSTLRSLTANGPARTSPRPFGHP